MLSLAERFLESLHSFLHMHWDPEAAKGSAAVLGGEFRRRPATRLIVERDARRTRRRDACCATAGFMESGHLQKSAVSWDHELCCPLTRPSVTLSLTGGRGRR